MKIEQIEYAYKDQHLVGELVFDDQHQGRRPGVLVAHDAAGLGDHPRQVARRLAALGYVAFALDYYGGGAKLDPQDIPERFGAINSDPDRIRATAGAGLETLLACSEVDPARVAAIGYCFGGTLSLELARGGADLRAVVGFHSGLSTQRPEDATNIVAKILVCIGAEDPIIPPEQRLAFEEEMRAGGADWQMNLYSGAVHSFTEPAADGSNPAIKYDQRTDERSWRAMLDLFAEVF